MSLIAGTLDLLKAHRKQQAADQRPIGDAWVIGREAVEGPPG